MKINISMNAKLRLVNEINELEKKAMGELFYSELKVINMEIDNRLKRFSEAEKEIFFGERYKDIDILIENKFAY
jgi:hypothetical protein